MVLVFAFHGIQILQTCNSQIDAVLLITRALEYIFLLVLVLLTYYSHVFCLLLENEPFISNMESVAISKIIISPLLYALNLKISILGECMQGLHKIDRSNVT